jgi:hypothetical protein
MKECLREQSVTRRRTGRHRVRRMALQTERIARIVLLWMLGVGLCIGAYHAMFSMHFFTIDQVVIRGDLQVLLESDILRTAGIREGDHLFRISMRGVQERLRRNPWVKEVAVRRKLPNAVWIYVVERKVVARLHHEVFYLIAEGGNVFPSGTAVYDADLPILTGISDLVIDAYGMGHSAQLNHLLDVYDLYEEHPVAAHFGCSEIFFDEFDQISLVTDLPAMQLRLGRHPQRAQFDRLFDIMSALQQSERSVSAVDLFLERKVVVRYAS